MCRLVLVLSTIAALAGSSPGAAAPPTPERVGQIEDIRDIVLYDGKAVVRSGTGDYRLASLPDGQLALAPVPPKAVRARPAGLLPQSEPVAGSRNVRLVWLAEPTDRYRHGVLGDPLEASALKVETASGEILSHDLSPSSVFEDLTPRLADIDGDGRDEIVVVRSYLESGSAVAVFGVRGNRLERLAESAPIGTPFRWLNPVGAADFDGDGETEVAVVLTPHIGGILVFYRRAGDRLVEIGRVGGVSTHAIGSTVLGMSAVLDLDGDGVSEVLLPDQTHHSLVAIGFADGGFAERWSIPHDRRVITSLVVADIDGQGGADVVYGLADGSVMAIRR